MGFLQFTSNEDHDDPELDDDENDRINGREQQVTWGLIAFFR